MEKILFTCTCSGINTTTNECYDCIDYLKCETFIDKLYEEDDINDDIINSDSKKNINDSIKIDDIDDDRDQRWWMNY